MPITKQMCDAPAWRTDLLYTDESAISAISLQANPSTSSAHHAPPLKITDR